MPFLKSPSGKISLIEDVKRVQELKEQGFVAISKEEEDRYLDERKTKFAELEKDDRYGDGIYFATVSPGGKDGYGTSSGVMMRELKKMGVKVSTQYQNQKVAILYHSPYSLLQIESPYRILYTMFESTRLPDDWKPYLDGADEIWVPSKWVAETFRRAGYDARVVPLGYDPAIFTPRPRPDISETHDEFVFLHYESYDLRKGFREVTSAFIKEFGPDEPVRLVLKTRKNQNQLVYQFNPSIYPRITTICGETTHQALRDLCYSANCFLFPSMGEGFGMTPLEAMATGMPAIVPNAHGISEYFNPDCMIEVDVEGETPAVYQRYKGQNVGSMVLCSVDDLRKKMRWAVTHAKEVKEMGERAAEYAKQWTLQNTAIKMKERLDEIMRMPLKDRPLTNTLRVRRIV